MPFSISQRKRREAIMGAELWQFSGGLFEVTCGKCGRQRDLLIADLVPGHGRQTIAKVSLRFRCKIPHCRGTATTLVLRGRGEGVRLIGPGAYA